MNTGFIKVSAVSPRVTVANVEKNLQNALKTVKAESESGSSLIVFPELYLTAYTLRRFVFTGRAYTECA